MKRYQALATAFLVWMQLAIAPASAANLICATQTNIKQFLGPSIVLSFFGVGIYAITSREELHGPIGWLVKAGIVAAITLALDAILAAAGMTGC